MINIALIVIAIVMVAAIAVANFYILVYFSSEEDKNTAIFPKIVVVVGLTLTCVNILMLPFDVANARTDGGIPTEILWIIIYVLMGVMIIVVIPFSIFYYEAEDPDRSNLKQVKTAIKYEAATLLVFTIIAVVLWVTLGTAEVPVTRLSSELVIFEAGFTIDCPACSKHGGQIKYGISFILYLISMLTLVGLLLFVVFGAIGLGALPMDLINAYRTRPKRISFQDYMTRKLAIGKEANALVEKGKKFQDRWKTSGGRPTTRREKKDYNQFRARVYILEERFNILEQSYGKGIGPRLLAVVWSYTQLVLGIVAIFLSILWLLHFILFLIPHPPISSFLNKMFIDLDNAFSLFGTVAYGVFSFYLLWCVIKGNFKFGLRIPFLFEIHPMKIGGTLMNSFLFNTLLLLMCSMTVVHFCSKAFFLYSRFTGIDTIFNVGVSNLKGFKYIWRYYYWVLFLLAIISLGLLIAFPPERKKKKGLSDLP